MRLIDENKLDFSECVLFARGGTIYADFGAIMKKIGEAPTIDPESLRPVGHWVYDPDGMDWGIGAWRCSECNTINRNLPANSYFSPYVFEGSSFCPHCGARMEAQDDD